MPLKRPSQIERFREEHYLSIWHVGLIFLVLIIPFSMHYYFQTISYDTPKNTSHISTTNSKENQSDQYHSHADKEPINWSIHVYDTSNTMESTTQVIGKIHVTPR